MIAPIVSTVGASENWNEIKKLLASDGEHDDQFGGKVSVDGNTVLIGAPYENNGSGSTYVFIHTGATWTQQAKLIASDWVWGDTFGLAVSLDGDTALIGAPHNADNGLNSGSAYVFIRTGTTWTQQAKLLPPDGGEDDIFGASVSLSGDSALIGAWNDDDNGINSGSVYVFTRTGTTWTQQAKLIASDGATQDCFGHSVSLNSNTALIGAEQDDDNGELSGSAFVFIRTGSTWIQQAKLLASDGVASARFGGYVSLSGDTALIGAWADDDIVTNSGSAYIFTRIGTIWTQQAKLLASDGAVGDFFGMSVWLDGGTTALIGAYYDDDNGADSGSAYIFTRTGTTWIQQAKLLPSDGAAGDFFGGSVSLSGDSTIIGSCADDDNGRSSGSAYVFTRETENQVPISDLSAGEPYQGYVDSEITFDGSRSSDSDGTITGYRWDFTNDGIYDTGWLTSAITTHSYSAIGTYSIKLEVTDDAGGTATDVAAVTISSESSAGTALLTANANGPYSGYVNYPISFSSAGSNGGSEGLIISWYWSFGDGVVSNAQNPYHIFTTAGTYTITLRITNNHNEVDIDSTTATISNLPSGKIPPVADAGGPYLGVVSSPIRFNGSRSLDSDGTIVCYWWNFGDSTTGTGVFPSHTYNVPGIYTVILTVIDNQSLTHSISTTAIINVSGPPTIRISILASNIEPIEEENEKTFSITIQCNHQSVHNIHLEILEKSNLTIISMPSNINLNPGECSELLITIKAPKLKITNTSETKVGDETIILRAVGDGNVTSNAEQINLKIIEKNATSGFELLATITAAGTAGALVAFFRRRN